MVDHDEVSFHKADDHEPREKADEYKRWLNAQFGLDPVDDPKPLLAAAQAKYKAEFEAWLHGFVE